MSRSGEPVRFGGRWIRRGWEPFVGAPFARRIARSLMPIQVLTITVPASWIVGIAHTFTTGMIRDLLGDLNVLLAFVFFMLIVVWLAMQARLRSQIRERLAAADVGVRSRPAILTPARFGSWLDREGIAREQAKDVLGS